MRFTEEQIRLARVLRDSGLDWQPAVGHFVYDDSGLIETPSPFQDRVYFILDLRHFLRRAGSLDALRTRAFWLPEWGQLRAELAKRGLTDLEVARYLFQHAGVEFGRELTCLYELLGEVLVLGPRADPGSMVTP